jgi:hypothetical protein
MIASLAVALAPSIYGQVGSSQAPAKDAAATANPALPSVDKVLDHYVEAVGGRAAWQKVKSRVSMGTIEVTSANLGGTVVIHEKAPDKILTIIIVSGSAFRQAFNGTAGPRTHKTVCANSPAPSWPKRSGKPISTVRSM